MTTAKNEVFIGLKHENCYTVGKTNLVMVVYCRGIFQVGRGEAKFSLVQGGFLYPPSRKNSLYDSSYIEAKLPNNKILAVFSKNNSVLTLAKTEAI